MEDTLKGKNNETISFLVGCMRGIGMYKKTWQITMSHYQMVHVRRQRWHIGEREKETDRQTNIDRQLQKKTTRKVDKHDRDSQKVRQEQIKDKSIFISIFALIFTGLKET